VGKAPHVVPYEVRDSGGAVAMAVIYVPARGAGAPYLKPGASISVPAAGSRTVDIGDYVIDPAGRPVRLTTQDQITASPTGGLTVANKGTTRLVLTAGKGYQGPAAITFQVTDGKTLTDKTGQYAVLTVPVQVGAATPVLRCPSTSFQLVEGGTAVHIPVASVCHVWTADPSQAASLGFTAKWKQRITSVRLSGSGSPTLSRQALGAAKPGATPVGASGCPSTCSVIAPVTCRSVRA
jgi:hypothetical protein